MANGRSPAHAAAAPGVLPEALGRPGARPLLEAAVVAFAERGYHGVSVRDLTSTVGIQSASFYAHFPSKEALLAELMIGGHELHQVHVRDAILGAGPDPIDQLRSATRANVEFQAMWPLMTIVCNSELHALAQVNSDRVLALRHDSGVLIVAVIERGNASGAFACADIWLAMSAIGAMGVRVAWWFRPPGAGDGVDDSPLASYPREAATWMSGAGYTVDTVAATYAEFALKIVGARP
ncbi:MAG TPA: TetR/AcrR family transcriptional regulator [Acidimicrobiales bacterium]|nr:TetR/AcrR family transcriptional regulator [Acidimicrobiales bacterium]